MPIVSYPCPFCQLLFLLNKGFPDHFTLHRLPQNKGTVCFTKKHGGKRFPLTFLTKSITIFKCNNPAIFMI